MTTREKDEILQVLIRLMVAIGVIDGGEIYSKQELIEKADRFSNERLEKL